MFNLSCEEDEEDEKSQLLSRHLVLFVIKQTLIPSFDEKWLIQSLALTAPQACICSVSRSRSNGWITQHAMWDDTWHTQSITPAAVAPIAIILKF